jgi:proteasome lid subunit RPN8/RPN11
MIPLTALRLISAHARACWPAECCGLVLEDAEGARTFRPIANVAGTAVGQGNSKRTQRDGYVMDPKALLDALRETEDSGGRLWAIVHSHPDVGAYFSKEDREMALGGGDEPLWPGVQYLVVSVRSTGVDGARLYTWDAEKSDFREEEVTEITNVS